MNKQSRTVNASKNFFISLVRNMVVLLLTFISRKFFIQYIGVEYLGINGLFSNVLTLLSMADLGMATAMNVSLYKPIAENNTQKLSALLNYFRTLYHYIALAVLIIGIGMMPFLKYIVNLNKDIPYLYVYYMVFVLKNVFSYLFVYKSAIIRADQRAYVVHRVDLIINIAKVALQIASIIVIHSYLIYILIDVLNTVVHNLVVSHIANKNYAFIRNRETLARKEKNLIFSDISSAFIYRGSFALINGTDNILMSVLISTVAVGVYSNYYSLTHNIEKFVVLIFSSLTASVGNLVATSSPQKRYDTFCIMQMVSFWLCGYVSICLLYLTQDFMKLWFGEEYLLDNLTLIAIVLNVGFSICMRPIWTFREGTGMYKQIRFMVLLTAVLNLFFSIALGKLIGISGILFATFISNLLTFFWYEPSILIKKFFNKSPKEYYISHIKNIIIIVLIGAVCWLPMKLINTVSFASWIAKAMVCTVIVSFGYFEFFRRSREFSVLKTKICSLLHARKE